MKNLLLITLMSFLIPQPAIAQAELKIEIKNIKNKKGNLLLIIDTEAKSFKTESEKDAFYFSAFKITDKKMNIKIAPFPQGLFAITVIHDENENLDLDTNLMGLPKEGIGFSRPLSKLKELEFSDIAVRFLGKEKTYTVVLDY